ncbi:SO_0444 family Cu/Zn efflux transporter [Pseudoalteromonas sp. OOF1S-7]|uniref:SO_0444 family Cu/Zn efflux transporter n=1 Tax=Pseudoalteromonas sp. OOF1S-7 TaxID=2917757 RepID=UPI001EF6619C|nr:SO_0444 family Cu/Zn efflux transporter [Pseudoalteromonas sp. OOF1S-7]MCG7537307.1 SO_0444 family Cu/Zn efflux transporter [Pseudoalteromonas sp. OOF1S-7]
MVLLDNFWQLFLVSAPWLMLGLLLAGLLNVFIPKDFLKKHLGKEGLWTTIKAALIGAPMPLCSCGVIPAAIGLRRAGGSKSATTAFLVSTPETGVDSISVSYALLGPFMAVIRPIAAVASAITAGVLVGKDEGNTQSTTPGVLDSGCCGGSAKKAGPDKSSCCATEPKPAPVQTSSCCDSQSEGQPVPQSSCCDSKPAQKHPEQASSCCASAPSNPGLWQELTSAVQFSCNKLLADTMQWLLIGLFFAALVQTYVPEAFLAQWGNGILAMLVVILVSIPMYICATASTPIAAGLLLAGVSPGAVLVFMLAGPATNVATIGVVAKELGRRAVFAYLGAVIGVAIMFGFLTDWLVAQFGFTVAPMMGHNHEVLPYWLTLSSGVVLALLMGRLMLQGMKQRFLPAQTSV